MNRVGKLALLAPAVLLTSVLLPPLVLLALRPQTEEESSEHNAKLQQPGDEKMSKSQVQPAHSSSVNDGNQVIEVAPKSAFIAVSEKSIDKGSATSQSQEASAQVVATEAWRIFLFKLLDQDMNGQIEKTEWANTVKGIQWADPMFFVFDYKTPDKASDDKIDVDEFKDKWDEAIGSAFAAMGAELNAAGKYQVDEAGFQEKWRNALETQTFMTWELDFVEDTFIRADKVLDQDEFEKFLFTAMMLRAIGMNDLGVKSERYPVTWAEVMGCSRFRFEGQAKGFPADYSTFQSKFAGGMDMKKLFDFLQEKKAWP